MGKKKNRIPYTYVEPKEEFYNDSNYNLSILPSMILNAGRGVYTAEMIPENSYIGKYCGQRQYYMNCGSYFVKFLDKPGGIDAITFPRCYMAMINDSYGSLFKNNCKMVEIVDETGEPSIEIWSINTIHPGEELFMSYGGDYWTNI